MQAASMVGGPTAKPRSPWLCWRSTRRVAEMPNRRGSKIPDIYTYLYTSRYTNLINSKQFYIYRFVDNETIILVAMVAVATTTTSRPNTRWILRSLIIYDSWWYSIHFNSRVRPSRRLDGFFHIVYFNECHGRDMHGVLLGIYHSSAALSIVAAGLSPPCHFAGMSKERHCEIHGSPII